MIDRTQPIAAAIRSDRDLAALVEEFFQTSFSTDNIVITEAVRRMLAARGKRLRPRLTLLAAEASGADAREHLPLAAYMELIHVGTLIHDDVVDRADMRRGVNATAVDFGNKVSVLAGDYLFAWIFKNVTANYPHPIPHILASTLADITDGEVLQHRAVGKLDLPVADYTEIAIKKTATLFAASAECGAIMSGTTPLRIKALRDFGLYYGIAFQMLDDLLDFTASESELGKPVGNDLAERKMTIPLILALQNGDANLRAAVARFYGDHANGATSDGATIDGASVDAASVDAASDGATIDAASDGASVDAATGGAANAFASSADAAGAIAAGAIAALVAGVAAAGGLEATREAIAGYVERAKMSLAPLGNAPARAELASLADALARDSAARAR